MKQSSLPLVPQYLLRQYEVEDIGDTRFRACARLLQSMWRQDQGFPSGIHTLTNEHDRTLGNKIDHESAAEGLNFLSLDIARLAHRECVYREVGAMIDEDRLWQNLLSSQPLCFNLFGPMKLDLAMATRFWAHVFPEHMTEVEAIFFEHSPGRADETFLGDHTAFDVLIQGRNKKRQKAFIAIEVKYSESMHEPPATPRARYDTVSTSSGIYREPDAPALRTAPLQQLWREHLLGQTMLDNGLYESGLFLVVYPERNEDCARAVSAYQEHLAPAGKGKPSFAALSLERCVAGLRQIEETATADALFNRYLDFAKVEEAIFGGPLYRGESKR